jgi:hypothetical protein
MRIRDVRTRTIWVGAVVLALTFGVGIPAAHSVLATCILSPTGGGVVYADKCFEGNLGRAINDAIRALNGQPGTVDATGVTHGLEIKELIVLGQQYQSIQLKLPPRMIVMRSPIFVGQDSSIVGFPVGAQVRNAGVSFTATTLVAADGANLPVVVQVGNGLNGPHSGDRAVLDDLIVDGNRDRGGTRSGAAAILVYGANGVDMNRVSALSSAGDGIRLQASNTPWRGAGAARLTKIMADGNARNGLSFVGQTYPQVSNDNIVSQSWFENSGWAGINLENASALRVNNSDLGGNFLGISSQGSSAQIITNNQFGGQKGHDVLLRGPAGGQGMHVITGNQFLGSDANRAAFYMAQIEDSSHNNISANSFNVANTAGGIRFLGITTKNLVSSNVFIGGTISKNIVGTGYSAYGNQHG